MNIESFGSQKICQTDFTKYTYFYYKEYKIHKHVAMTLSGRVAMQI